MSKELTLTEKFAGRYGVESTKLLATLKATAFSQKADRNGNVKEITNEQMMALMVVADQYHLNPFTKEIYAFPDKQGIIPVVGIDGWSRIINSDKNFDGMEFVMSDNLVTLEGSKECPDWIECVMYRKDRTHPVKVREYLDEVYRPPFKGKGRNGDYTIDGPWQSHTKRFLRHKAMIQCARIAFGFVGIYDQDEAERIEASEINDADVVEAYSEPAEPELVMYPQDRFDTVFPKWEEAVASGKKTHDEMISTLSSKGELSEEMLKQINAIKVIEVVEGEIVEENEQ